MSLGNTREVVEECLKWIATLEVVDQRLNRNPGSAKHWGSAQAVRRGRDEGVGSLHCLGVNTGEVFSE